MVDKENELKFIWWSYGKIIKILWQKINDFILSQ